MTYERLVRYGLWAALIAALLLGAWYITDTLYDSIYEDGRIAERSEWQAKELQYQRDLKKAVSAAEKAMAEDQDKQINGLLGAIQDEAKAKIALEKQLNDERANNRGLWISAKACSGSASGAVKKDQSASGQSSPPDRIRLPSKIESDLRELAADAQRVVIQYETARKLVESCPQIEIVKE